MDVRLMVGTAAYDRPGSTRATIVRLYSEDHSGGVPSTPQSQYQAISDDSSDGNGNYASPERRTTHLPPWIALQRSGMPRFCIKDCGTRPSPAPTTEPCPKIPRRLIA